MQRQSMFQGNWELNWSAGVTTVMAVFMLVSCISGLWEYREMAGGTAQMILSVLFMMSPMLIGLVLNLIGTIRRIRPLLFIAGTFYVLSVMFGLVMLLYNVAPAILAFRAFYKMGKRSAKPPRLG